jgi:flagellin-specific chaperone FliS
LLIQANVQKSAAPIDEFLAHATALRDTWAEAFDAVDRNTQPGPAGTVPETGSIPRMNVTG